MENERAGAEIVRGKEVCERFADGLLKELGFPSGVQPTGELEEFGRVRATGFVWWKCKAAFEHFSVATKTKASYAAETAAYVENGRMKKLTGVKIKRLMVWVPLTDIEGNKITFKTPMGIGKSFPLISFMNKEEKKIYLQQNSAAK